MKKIFLLLTLSVFASSLQIFADDALTAKPKPTNLIIDGNNSEWELPFKLFNYNTGLMFAISNDNENLYLCFAINDEHKLQKMLHAGWSIELLSKDKKNKFDATISFPKVQRNKSESFKNKNQVSDNNSQNLTDKREKLSLSELIDNYKLQVPAFTIKGFNATNISVPFKAINGINVDLASNTNNNEESVVYELAIPLKQISDKSLFDLKKIELNVTVNALEMPASGSFGSGSSGGRHEDGGGNGGGEYGGGNGGGYGRGNGGGGQFQGNGRRQFDETMFAKATLKQAFKLGKL